MSIRKREWKTRGGEPREAWVFDYVDQAGKRHIETFKRKKDAEARKVEVLPEVKDGTHSPKSASVTVATAGEEWLESCEEAGLERTTIDQYRQHLTFHITPFLGAMKLSQLSVPGVRTFQGKLRKEGRSPAMVKRVTVSLGSILADAQERGRVSRNVVREMARNKTRGKVRQSERRQKRDLQVGVDIPTPAEVRAIMEKATSRWRPLLVTAIFTGLRASELRGLTWRDVDLQNSTVHVRQRADKYNAMGMPKSKTGQRSIPIPPMVVNTLREWKLACPNGALGLVFPTSTGKHEGHSNIVKRGLQPTQVAAGVVTEDGEAKYSGLHALRHFFASWCINPKERGGLGLSPKEAQERLGHSSITMTMDTYGHLFPKTDDSAALAEAESRLLTAV